MCDSLRASLRKLWQRLLFFIDSVVWVLAVMFGTLATILEHEPMIFTQDGNNEQLEGDRGTHELSSH